MSGLLLEQLGVAPYRQRFPWLGGDLQTLRDTLRPMALPPDQGQPLQIAVPALASGAAAAGQLLAFLDRPSPLASSQPPKGLVLLLHGLGGSSRREGLRRLGLALQASGFTVLRLNLRGADPGRHLAGGTYAAACNSDLLPALIRARELAGDLAGAADLQRPLPLFGAGLSLGGTMLLNAALSTPGVLDGLFCASSPLDLAAAAHRSSVRATASTSVGCCSGLCARPWPIPFGVREPERQQLEAMARGEQAATIRAFDAAITAPRWSFASVEAYYGGASPLPGLLEPSRRSLLPPTLLLQALDDPWVPAAAAQALQSALQVSDGAAATEGLVSVVLTPQGGHNGFHGRGDGRCNGPEPGCWSDRLALAWFDQLRVSAGVCGR